jgi:DNA-binding winged helix-turn-helix (wHTH) protein
MPKELFPLIPKYEGHAMRPSFFNVAAIQEDANEISSLAVTAAGLDSRKSYESVSVALVNGGFLEQSSILTELAHARFDVVKFNSPSEFMTGFWRHKKFSLLVIAASNDEDFDLISKFIEVANAPALLLMDGVNWTKLLPLQAKPPHIDVLLLPAITGQELIWRMEKLLHGAGRETHFEAGEFSWGDYRFVNGARTVVFVRGNEIQLQRRQFIFALLLFSNIGHVVTRGKLSEFFGVQPKENSRALDVCAVHVRKKLGLCAENGLVLRAVYGLGYQLIPVSNAERAARNLSAETADFQRNADALPSFAGLDRSLTNSPASEAWSSQARLS